MAEHLSLPVAEQLMQSAIARTCDYFSQEFGIRVTDMPESDTAPDSLALTEATAIIGLHGAVNLWVAFSPHAALAHLIFERLTADFTVAPHETAMYRDAAMGEMANTVLGHCTADLQALDTIALPMTPPVVLSAAKRIQHRNNALWRVHRLMTDSGSMDIAVVGPAELFNHHLDYLE